jgi:hypothetical protein
MSSDIRDLELLLMVEQLSSEIVTHVYVYVKSGDPPRIFGVFREQNPELAAIGLEEHDVESHWTVPSRRQMEEYRREAATINRQNGMVMVDEMRLADEIVSNHLKKLLMGGKEIELKESPTKPGSITKRSLDKLKEMHSGFYDTFYTQYRSEACLIT